MPTTTHPLRSSAIALRFHADDLAKAGFYGEAGRLRSLADDLDEQADRDESEADDA